MFWSDLRKNFLTKVYLYNRGLVTIRSKCAQEDGIGSFSYHAFHQQPHEMNPLVVLIMGLKEILIIEFRKDTPESSALFPKSATEDPYEQHVVNADQNVVRIMFEKTLLGICFSEVKEAVQHSLNILVGELLQLLPGGIEESTQLIQLYVVVGTVE